MEEVHSGWDQRPGNYGVKKTLGPFTQLERNRHLDPRLRDILHVSIASSLSRTEAQPLILLRSQKHDGDLITLKAAKRKFRTSQTVLAAVQQAGISTFRAKSGRKSPVLVSVTELGNVLAARADLLTPLAAARRLGLPILALPHLARANLVNAVETADECLPRYSRHSVDELIARLIAQTTTEPVPAHTSTLCTAAVQLGAPHVSPWVGLLEAVLDGRIPAWRSKVKQPVAMSLFVDASDACNAVTAFDMWASDGDDPVLAGPCVASMLGLYLTTVRSLMRQSLISDSPTLSELQVFSREYLSTRQVRDILRTHSRSGRALSIQARIDCRTLPFLLQILGLKPLRGCVEAERNFFWKRAEIDRLAEAWPMIGGMFADLQSIQAQ